MVAAGLEPGDTLVVETDVENPDVLRLRRVRNSYAGALKGVYGDARNYLEDERRSWEGR